MHTGYVSVRNGLLALLEEGPKHGFQLKKELEERTGALWQVNVGQVYTTLRRLERDGLVVADGTPSGSHADDQRPYRLTEDGRREVEEWFATPRPREAPDRDELVVKVTLALELDHDVTAVIDDQRRVTTEALQRHTRAKARSDEADLARLFAVDATIAQIDAELRWLDLCQARLAQRATTSPRTQRPRRGGAR
jgi:DNA-binding PadR family transcriptional regulator